MRRLGLTLACWLAVSGAAWAQARVITEPRRAHRVDYLVVSADALAGGLGRLAEHREQGGLRVGIVSMSAVVGEFKTLRAFLAHAATQWTPPAPSYLLLVGDGRAVPAIIKPNRLKGWLSSRDLATDFDYARPIDDRAVFHVGRFPATTAEELATMIDKTLAYETQTPDGAWQRRLNFVAEVGGFGRAVDTLLEGIATAVLSSRIPPEYDLRAAYANESSPYCPAPDSFPEHVVGMLNDGALLTVLVGHGQAGRFGTIRGRAILRSASAAGFQPPTRSTILLALACHTGRFDGVEGMGVTYLRAANGPVAFLGGSRVTQPYANALLAQALTEAVFGDAETLGEALTRAKLAMLSKQPAAFRGAADLLGGMMQGRAALDPMRQDGVEHYNLLGDPALRLRRPKLDIEVTVADGVVHIAAPGKDEVELWLECDRLMFRHPLPAVNPAAPEAARQFAERYRLAHDKLVQRWTVRLVEGRGRVAFEPPVEPGRYLFKAASGASAGVAVFTVAPRND